VKRKSDASDERTFGEEEKNREPQQKRAAPSLWGTTEKEEAPPVSVKRKNVDEGEYLGPDQQNCLFAFVYICVS
jgi:hypothetical protein